MTDWTGGKLHLGCGDKLLAGWINVDGQAGPGVDAVIDIHANGLAAIPDGVLSWVYSSHVIEHLYPDHLPGVLANLYRALAPGGVLTLATTSLEGIYENAYRKGYTPSQWNCYLFGASWSVHHPMMAHRQVFTAPYLQTLLETAGFREVRPWVTTKYSQIHDLNDCARSSWHVSLNLEATK